MNPALYYLLLELFGTILLCLVFAAHHQREDQALIGCGAAMSACVQPPVPRHRRHSGVNLAAGIPGGIWPYSFIKGMFGVLELPKRSAVSQRVVDFDHWSVNGQGSCQLRSCMAMPPPTHPVASLPAGGYCQGKSGEYWKARRTRGRGAFRR